MHQEEGGRVTSGQKNAYCLLWLVHKFAGVGARTRARAGSAPGCYVVCLGHNHIAQGRFTHIIYSLFMKFQGTQKSILQYKRVGGKLTQTELLFSKK